jgi:Flp pilus assembly protein TadD
MNEVTDTLAWVHYKRKSYALAVPLFRECVRKQPDHALYHYHLGLALLGEDDKPHARTELQAAIHLKLTGNDATRAQQLLDEVR